MSAIRLQFWTTNNDVEYEELVEGLKLMLKNENNMSDSVKWFNTSCISDKWKLSSTWT